PHLQQQRAPTPTTQRNLDVQMAATIEQSPSTAVTALPSAGQLLATHNFIQNQLQCIDDFLAPWMAVRFHLQEADRNICIIQSRATPASPLSSISLSSPAPLASPQRILPRSASPPSTSPHQLSSNSSSSNEQDNSNSSTSQANSSTAESSRAPSNNQSALLPQSSSVA